jgi:hypothetical protein
MEVSRVLPGLKAAQEEAVRSVISVVKLLVPSLGSKYGRSRSRTARIADVLKIHEIFQHLYASNLEIL